MLAGMAFEGSPFLRHPGEFWMNLGVFLLLCCCLGGGGGQDETASDQADSVSRFYSAKDETASDKAGILVQYLRRRNRGTFFFRSNEGLLHSLFVQKRMQYCCMLWFRLKNDCRYQSGHMRRYFAICVRRLSVNLYKHFSFLHSCSSATSAPTDEATTLC
jgi:hypothetical protein